MPIEKREMSITDHQAALARVLHNANMPRHDIDTILCHFNMAIQKSFNKGREGKLLPGTIQSNVS